MATRDELTRLTSELVRTADHQALAEGASDARKAYGDSRSLIDRIAPAVDPFLHFPDDGAYASRLSDFSYALSRLSPGDMPADLVSGGKSFLPADTELIGSIRTMSQNLTTWTGAAAQEFKESFANRLEARLKNHFLATQVLHAMLAAEQELWRRTTDDLAQLLKDAKIAIDRLDDCDSSPAESFLLTLIGASIATVSAPLGGLAIIVWTGVSSIPGLIVAGEALRGEKPKIQIEGGTLAGVLRSTLAGIDTIVQHANTMESRFADITVDNLQVLTSRRDDFVSPHPHLADATSANGMTDEYLGRQP